MPKLNPLLKLLLTASLLLASPALTGRSATTDAGPPILLQSRTLTPTPGVEPALIAQVAARPRGHIHVLLQLTHIPTPAEREALAGRGIVLQHYVPQQAWIATLDAGDLAAVAAHPIVRWVGPWQARDKLAPTLGRGQFGRWMQRTGERVQVMVMPHADVSLSRGAALIREHGGVVAGRLIGPHALTAWVAPETLPALAAEEAILWIDEGALPLEPTNDGVRASMGVDDLQAAPHNLSGEGVNVLVFDAGTVDSHDDFDTRLTVVDSAIIDEHATHVAGTVGGSGLRSADDGGAPEQWRGVAPGVNLLSAGYEQSGGTTLFWDNAGDVETDYAVARNTYGADLATNSIGSNVASNGYACEREGDYGVTSQLLDGIVRGDNSAVGSPYIATWANGNERTGSGGRCGSTYHTTAPPACAKNPIHVGAINSDYDSMTTFSSWGPCDDGRLKPTVSAPGCETGLLPGSDEAIKSTLDSQDGFWDAGPYPAWPPYYIASPYCGTSMATPAVAGVVALLLEAYRDVVENPQVRPSNALVKAWLIHTARDLGNDGPDYMFGYGKVDALAAADLVRSGAPSAGASTARYLTATLTTHGQADVYTFTLPARVGELRASLVWDDVAAAPFVSDTHALVNDLDLTVLAPDSTAHRPWVLDADNPHLPAQTGVNDRDNQEQVVVANPISGDWRVVVTGTLVPQPPQPYALVVTHHVSRSLICDSGLANSGFETGGDWALDGGAIRGTARTYAGDYALRLGGTNNVTQTAHQTVTIPLEIASANLSYRWTMTTTELSGYGYDRFYAQVRNSDGAGILAVYDLRSDRYPQDLWLIADNIDLTPFAGQTVRLYLLATTDGLSPSAFYVDEVALDLCRLPFEAQAQSHPNPVVAGERLTYTLTLTNGGDLDLTAIAITDTLPQETHYAASPSGFYSPTAHAVYWSGLTLSVGQSISLTLWVTPDLALPHGATLINDYLARSGEGVDASARAQTTVANLNVKKLAEPDPVYAGATLTYTLYAENPWSRPADLTLSDDLPDGLTFSAFLDDDDGQASYAAGRVVWSDVLGAGITDVVRFTGHLSPTAPATLQNVAVLTEAGDISWTATSDVNVLRLNIELTKTVQPATAHVGSVLTYAVQFANHETAPQDIVVRDPLPPEVSFGGFVDDGGGAVYLTPTRTLEWRGQLAAGSSDYITQAVSRSFVDISGVGTALSGWAGSITDDEGYVQVSLPWPFDFYDIAYTALHIGSNGNVGFDPFTFGGFWDQGAIPHTSAPNNRIALYYYDQDGAEGTGGSGTIYAYHDTVQDRFIVQYDGWQEWQGSEVSTYEVILYPDGRIELIYGDVSEAAELRGPAGVENADGSAGVVIAEQPGDGDAFLVTPQVNATGFVYTATVLTLPPEGIVNTAILTDPLALSRSASVITLAGHKLFLPILLRGGP